MKLNDKLIYIDKSINENIIDLSKYSYYEIPAILMYFELEEYIKIILELNKERDSKITYDEKQDLINQYIVVYKSCKKKYNKLLRNIKDNNLEIKYPEELEENKEYMYKNKVLHLFDEGKSLHKNIQLYMELKLKQRIEEINEELYRLKSIPSFYINTFSTFIGPSNPSRYTKDIFFYKDVNIMVSDGNRFSVFYNEKSKEETKNTLLGIIAYLNATPYFYFTENYNFNKKIGHLYEQFDLLDILRLRDKEFFHRKDDEDKLFMIETLIKSNKQGSIYFEESNHEMLFELYHASLKQFEPLPRCVFLYRVFEYGAKYHYQKMERPTEYKVEDAIEYYVDKIMKHKYNPLYFRTYKKTANESKYIENLICNLKKEVKIIKKEWNKHEYLKNKSIGEIIYKTGRNAVAHGGCGRLNARYDYLNNYKHINDVNIFLELIARYIIEILNPQLTNRVERRKKYYKNIF
ncbi:hypothetical protein [Intestinibacter bartlettii]|uniref:hypothetical protein n=1 Tax=Intestinibacter bartlettii TaxID=261299 RepID=UPI0034A29618